MTLFQKQPLYQSEYLSYSIPNDIIQMIEQKEYDSAAESLITQKIPFNYVIKMISNCPKLLTSYLYKQSSMFISSPVSQQLIWHLYLQTALFNLDPEEIKRVSLFINEHKQGLDKDLVLKWVMESGELNLVQTACLAFNDYTTLIEYLMSTGQYQTILQYLMNVPPNLQRAALLRVFPSQTMLITEFLSNAEIPPTEAIFDTFVNFAYKENGYENQTLRENIDINFQTYYEQGLLTEPAHFHIYLIHLIMTNQTQKIKKFFKTPDFQLIDSDFIVHFLEKKKMYTLAAELYAYTRDRHSLAVKYALCESEIYAMNLLQNPPLSKAHDISSLWIQLLKTLRDSEDNKKYSWSDLISGANKSGALTLDDIFPLVPTDMPMDSLSAIIAEAVQRSSDEIKSCEELRGKIEQRASTQRDILNKPNLKPLEINPIEATCFLCGQTVCDSRFVIYPCGHVVHTSCYMSSVDTKHLTSNADDDTPYRKNQNGEQIADEDPVRLSCPACGTASLSILNKPFVTSDDAQEAEKWFVPE